MKTFNRMLFFTLGLLLTITACTFNNNELEDTHLYRILVGDKYGFMDARGKIVIEPQFDEANLYFSEGLCCVKSGERVGLIDSTGTFVVELADTAWAGYFVKGLAQVDYGYNKRGIINRNGEFVISPNYLGAYLNIDGDSVYIRICEGECLILDGRLVNDSQSYMADKNGNKIGEIYDDIHYGFCNGLCSVTKNGKDGYIDSRGKQVIDTIYDFAANFSEDGMARVRKGNEWFYINKKGKEVIKVDHALTDMVCKRAAVVMNEKKCLIDEKGKIICDLDVDSVDWSISSFSVKDSLATIIKDGKAAKIDTTGRIVFKTDYEWIGPFIDGLARVRKPKIYIHDDGFSFRGGIEGYIDKKGNEVISVSHDNQILSSIYWDRDESLINNDNSHDKEFSVRAVADNVNETHVISYYDLQGNLLWKDMPNTKKELPGIPTKEDCKEYFDARIAELDPIEGIYYVTSHHFYQNRQNPNISGSNGTKSEFYAIVKNQEYDDFWVYCVDKPLGRFWINRFVKIGNSNSYAIMDNNEAIPEHEKYSSEGRVTIDDPYNFGFQLELESRGFYNFYVTYEFVKDYPLATDYEMVQRAEWSGTGFAIYDGYIATNYHVANGAKTIRVRGIDGDMKKSYKGFVVAKDKEHDIAIIRIADKDFDGFGEIPYAIGKAVVDVGDDIFVLGYPMTDTMGEEIKLTDGVISSSSGYKGNESMYQISAAVQPGNSGGPLFNEDGSVIGIVCAKHADAENANYAIKVSYLYSLINSAKLEIDISNNNHEKSKKLSEKVKKFKSHVYLIECSSR